MEIRLAGNLQKDSIVDGEGLRTVIWTQGCSHNCLGCHNPETHDFNAGFSVDIEEVKKEIKNLQYQDGITFSGGDPFFQASACAEIAKYAKELGLNIWSYTGYTYEQLLDISKKNPKILEFLKSIDVLVDGRFVLTQKSLNVKFRGSTNQRIIDVKKSLNTGKTCIITKYDDIDNMNLLKKRRELYI